MDIHGAVGVDVLELLSTRDLAAGAAKLEIAMLMTAPETHYLVVDRMFDTLNANL